MYRWLIAAGLTISSLALFLAAFEGLLRSGLMDDVSIHWIPERYKSLDQRIFQRSADRFRRHPYGFNGPITSFETTGGKSRIVLLGDSFVWGKGLPFEQSWGRKLEKHLQHTAPHIELVEWARNGWSTVDQLKFLETKLGGRIDANYAVVGFTVNDPDLTRKDWILHRKEIDWNMMALEPARAILPNTVDFLTGHIDAILELATDDFGYGNWIRFLWSDDNLIHYRTILRRMKTLFESQGIPLLFAFTPQYPNAPYFLPKHKKIASILDELGIPYVDLYPFVAAAFNKESYGPGFRELWANPADGHPGDAVTSVLADAVLAHLQDTGVIRRLAASLRPSATVRLGRIPLCPLSLEFAIDVVRMDHYELSKGKPYYRIQGIALEHVSPQLLDVQSVYLSIGGVEVPALANLPLHLLFPNGRLTPVNGWFALDVPAAETPDPTVDHITVVSKNNCKMVRKLSAPRRVEDAIPPNLQPPPMVAIGKVISMAW